MVLTGYVGQISLMQMTFAGLGGFITAKLASDYHVPFPLSIIAAALIVAPIGVALGLPALRVRGLSLAVVTLGAAIAVDAVFFQNTGLDERRQRHARSRAEAVRACRSIPLRTRPGTRRSS